MARLKPGVSSYARVAYARELLGDLDGARAALLLARDAAADEPEPFAWTETQLGKLELGRGRLAAAAAHLRSALRVVPRLRLRARRARAGRGRHAGDLGRRGRTRAARGRDDPAAAVRRPLRRPAARDGARARSASCSTRPRPAIRRLLDANGVRTDLETALFDVDHGIRLHAAARAAREPRSALGRRSTATTCSPGRSRATAAAARRCRTRSCALRLGTQDAAKLFHRACDRALPRPRPAPVGASRGRAQPPLLGPLGPDAEEARLMKRLLAARSLLLSLLVPRRSPRRTRSATSRSTASRASRSPATGSTSATSSTWRRSRRCSASRCAPRRAARHASTARPRAANVANTALAHPLGAAGLRTTRFQAILAGPRVDADGAGRRRRPQLRRPDRLEGDRLRRATRARPRTSCARTRRTCSASPLDVTRMPRPDSAPTNERTADAPLREAARGARPRRGRRLRLARRPASI